MDDEASRRISEVSSWIMGIVSRIMGGDPRGVIILPLSSSRRRPLPVMAQVIARGWKGVGPFGVVEL